MSSISDLDSLKVAMWRVYGHKCAYTQEDLAMKDLVLDHVVPRYLRESPAKQAEVWPLYGLGSDFDIHGVENLVPTSAAFNQRKSAKTGPDEIVERISPGVARYLLPEESGDPWSASAFELITYGLKCAEENREAVCQEQKKVQAQQQFRELLEKLPPGTLDPVWLHDYSAKEEAEFIDRSKEFPAGKKRVLVRPRVYLSFNLPAFPDLGGSALLLFKSLKVRDCMVTFGPKTIPDQLLRGFGTGLSVEHRPFLRAENEGEYWVYFGNVSFWLPRDEVEDLCAIVDEFAELYLEKARAIEGEVLRSMRFPWARWGYQLLWVPHYVWLVLLRFAREHDYEAGSSEWHIFDGRGDSFQFVCEHPNDEGQKIRAILHSERDPESDLDTSFRSDGVWICWDGEDHTQWTGHEDHFRTGVAWNAEVVLARLQELVPQAVAWAYEQERRQRSRGFAGYLPRLFDRIQHRKIRHEGEKIAALAVERTRVGQDSPRIVVDPFESFESLQITVTELQLFASARRSAYLSSTAVVGLLEYLRWCVERFDLSGVTHYLGSSLKSGAAEPLQDAIGRKIASTRESSYASSHTVDHTARCLVVLLRDGRPQAEHYKLLSAARRHLGPLIKEFHRLAYVERLARKPW